MTDVMIQFLGTLITIAGLFIWNRTENRTDYRHLETMLSSQRALMAAIHEENKQFHNRLCKIEANRRKRGA